MEAKILLVLCLMVSSTLCSPILGTNDGSLLKAGVEIGNILGGGCTTCQQAANAPNPTGALPVDPTSAVPANPTGALPANPTGALPANPAGSLPVNQPTGLIPAILGGC